jgi:hypothetical protein
MQLPGRSSRVVLDAVVASCLGAVYLWTLMPGTGYSGDTAIFQFVGKVLGVSHAPGSPTYVLLNHLWVSALPFGSLAWRANLLSAVLAVAACVVLRHLVEGLGAGAFASTAAAIAFGLTPTFWTQSVVAEVYSLHALFVAATLLLLLHWSRDRRDGLLVAACAVYAVSFGNHLTAVTLLPAFAWFVWHTDRHVFARPRLAVVVVAVVLAAAAQYLYVPWRCADPSTPFALANVNDPASFVAFVTGGSFRGRMFDFTWGQMLADRIPLYLADLWHQLGPLVALAPLGWIALRRRRSSGFNTLLALAFAGNTLFALGYRIGDIEVLFIPSTLVVAVWIGCGMGEILDRLHRFPQVLRLALVAGVPAALLVAGLPEVNRHHDTAIQDSLERMLTALEPTGAVVLTPNYNVSGFLWYELIGEGWQQRGLYLMPHNAGESGAGLAAFVRAYLVDGQTYRVPAQRLEVPAGLPVYCLCSVEQRGVLRNDGLRLVRIMPSLYRVLPPP